jgi:hypothetical protein
MRNYHRVLDTILAGIFECQKNPPVLRIQLRNEWTFMRVHIVVNCVLGNALSNDVICGRAQSRRGTLRLCRACHIPKNISNNPHHQCKFLVQSQMERIINAAPGPETDPFNKIDN